MLQSVDIFFLFLFSYHLPFYFCHLAQIHLQFPGICYNSST